MRKSSLAAMAVLAVVPMALLADVAIGTSVPTAHNQPIAHVRLLDASGSGNSGSQDPNKGKCVQVTINPDTGDFIVAYVDCPDKLKPKPKPKPK